MAKRRSEVTCDDCYFRRAGLCALTENIPCPTFRAASVGTLLPPKQPQLVARPLPHIAAVAAVAAA